MLCYSHSSSGKSSLDWEVVEAVFGWDIVEGYIVQALEVVVAWDADDAAAVADAVDVTEILAAQRSNSMNRCHYYRCLHSNPRYHLLLASTDLLEVVAGKLHLDQHLVVFERDLDSMYFELHIQ